MLSLSPIAVFVYKRPLHTQKTIESLQRNALALESDLHIFSDGAKARDDVEGVAAVRKYIKTIGGFRSIKVIERETNLGLSKSIISGVTQLCNQYGSIIVLEDDLVTSPYFLQYMNQALQFYEREERVICIHGYILPLVASQLPETFFLKGTDCWGWATWKRGWNLFEPDGSKLLAELKRKKFEKAFDYNGTYPNTKMLANQILGKNDSWAIRWYASAFLKEKFTLYPGITLVENIGMDGSGRHQDNTTLFSKSVSNAPVVVQRIPLEENSYALCEIQNFFRSIKPTIFSRIKRKFVNL